MSYDETHQKRSRVVVETPAARREVVETRTAYAAPERRGVSTGVVAIVAIAAVVLTAIVVWALTRPSADDVNANLRVTTQPTPVTQTQVVTVPVPQQQQPPVVIPPATTTTTTQPVIVPVPSTSTSTSSSTTTTDTPKTNGTDDATLQSSIDKRLSDDPKIATLGISASVSNGKVTLIGTVDSREMKNRIERMVRIKGVKTVDNQITVSGSADSTAAPQD